MQGNQKVLLASYLRNPIVMSNAAQDADLHSSENKNGMEKTIVQY